MADKQRQGRQGRARQPQGRQAPEARPGRRRPSRRKAEGRKAAKAADGRRRRSRASPRSDVHAAAASTHFEQVVRKKLDRAVRLQEPHAGADAREDRAQHGRRRGRQRPQEGRAAPPSDLALIAGQKAVITKSRKSIATYKLRDGQADRLQGHAAQDAHVRVPRPAGHHRAAARARLPRPQPEELRRPRQLRARHQGAHHLPGDRLRQGRPDVWGMDITSARRAKTDDEARALLAAFNFPFRQ